MIKELSNIYMEEGLKNLHRRKLTTAEMDLKKAVSIDNNNWKAKNLQGLCLYTRGEFDRALSLWKDSININSEESNRAHFYVESMKEKDFIKLCEVYNKSLQYSQTGVFKNSKKLLRDSVLDECNIIPFLNFKGLCMLAAGERNEAIDIWKKVLFINKENEEARNYIINSLDKKYDNNFVHNILRKLFKTS